MFGLNNSESALPAAGLGSESANPATKFLFQEPETVHLHTCAHAHTCACIHTHALACTYTIL